MAYKNWFRTRKPADLDRYRTLKSAAKRAVAKVKHLVELYDELDTSEGAKKIYRLASSIHQSTQAIAQVTTIKVVNHRPPQDPPAILQQ